jgi:adenine-specific DNA-methyltransferase
MLVDFYGVRIVKGAGVDNIILNVRNTQKNVAIDFYRLKELAKGRGTDVFVDIKNKENKYSRNILVNHSRLRDEGWSFLNNIEENVLDKIKGIELGEICEGFQGIITGCDNAFVLPIEKAEEFGAEEYILKPWIKSSNIKAFSVKPAQELIIYSDMIGDENCFQNAINHISIYRERLEKRRECIKGIRKWHQLQWGRRPELFENRKIIYPYKSSRNRFALDDRSYFSADVYGIVLRNMFAEKFSYEYLAGILNSRIYEFYIKSIAKKLGDDLYEYYPNKIMMLRIPEYIREIEDEVLKDGEDIRNRIDGILVEYFGLSTEEYDAVKEWVKEK